jgi:aldehyde:ferredoxin oxidoreductase
MPYHDARALSGMALVYATSPRGACHNQSDYLFVDWGHSEEELNIGFFERQAGAEKAANVARHQDWRTVNNALVMCILATIPPGAYVELINAATGYGMDLEEMMRCGERSWNLKRAINIRLGLTAAHDTLPKAVLEPYKDGGAAGFTPDLKTMLTAYYQARQWDAASGKPSKSKLIELGLGEIAADLWQKP